MTVKNSYVKCSRISERKFRQIVRLFAVDLEA
ncbi:MAG: IS1595 family transposase, partial [Deltaproteobacteria bacterium]|nr:IS1595 family transposase [Deltaproteobacteria bacterium]MCR4287417.1 IS1595 family transposase [Deltaproteobacteria bacterium]